jgi:hypothetical protein
MTFSVLCWPSGELHSLDRILNDTYVTLLLLYFPIDSLRPKPLILVQLQDDIISCLFRLSSLEFNLKPLVTNIIDVISYPRQPQEDLNGVGSWATEYTQVANDYPHDQLGSWYPSKPPTIESLFNHMDKGKAESTMIQIFVNELAKSQSWSHLVAGQLGEAEHRNTREANAR